MGQKSSKIKVLFTIPNFDTAGSGIAVFKVAAGLNKEIFEPHIFCLHDRGTFFQTVKKSGIPVHIFQFTFKVRPVWRIIVNVWRISKFFKRNKFHIVHSYHYAADYSEGLAVKMAGIKWGYTKKNMNWGGSSKNGWKLRSFFADFIAVQNSDMIDLFYPRSNKTYLLPAGVDTTEFFPQKRDKKLLTELQLDDSSKIIMNVANMVPLKNLDILIRAFSQISDQKALLMLVGDNENNHGIELGRLVENLNIKHRVFFTGKRMDVSRFLSIAHLFVLPSSKEGSPIALLEAMACGVPVIGTQIPGIKDQLAKFPEFIVPVRDVDALRQKMEEVLAMPQDKLDELRQTLVDEVQNSFTLKQEIARHEEMYKKCLKIK